MLCVCVCVYVLVFVCVCVSFVQDKLLRHLRRMRMVYGPVYDFFPPSYILPRERAAFEAEVAAQSEKVRGGLGWGNGATSCNAIVTSSVTGYMNITE